MATELHALLNAALGGARRPRGPRPRSWRVEFRHPVTGRIFSTGEYRSRKAAVQEAAESIRPDCAPGEPFPWN